jgi:PAS domain S-box-containing protein
VLRGLIAGKQPGDSIRVWTPGCATGEEPYSIAILLAELLGDRLSSFEVNIFATDVDQGALDVARSGIYSSEALATLTEERRQRWFTPEGSGWRIGKTIRNLCVFSVHDVIAHPPFIKMDLVSCRNLLIYFKPEQQVSLIQTFHYGLNPDGLLLLGRSESAGFNSSLFETVDGAQKIFRRRSGTAARPVRFARLTPLGQAISTPLAKASATSKRQSMLGAAMSMIAGAYAPPGVLVNASFEPLHFFGSSRRYFSLPDDHADFSVFALCLPELRNELKAIGYRLVQECLSSLEGVPIEISIGGETIRVKPVLRHVAPTPDSRESAFLFSFEETRLDPASPSAPNVDAADRLTRENVRLRQELADTREHLQAVIEEFEASNEELQTLNEEIQSSSEELQASNEELQSSNEELTTLNDELRIKSQEATQLTTTLGNIQNSIRTSLVVVDREGHVTRYNSLATRIFGLVPNDIGQGLYGVPCHLPLPNLRMQVNEVIASGISLVERVHQSDFQFLMQIDPYRNESGKNDGAVLTFADISELYRAEVAKEGSEVRFRHVWEACLEGLLVVDGEGRIAMANPALYAMFGYASGELIGQPLEILIPVPLRERHTGLRSAFAASPQARQMMPMRDLFGLRKDGSTFFVEVSLSGMPSDGARYVMATVTDITIRKEAEIASRQSKQRLQLALDAAHAGSWEWSLESNQNIWSEEIWNLYGLDRKQVLPSYVAWQNSIAPLDKARVVATINDAVDRAAEFEIEWRVQRNNNQSPRWLLSRGRPTLDADGKPTSYNGIVLDISERKAAEEQRQQSAFVEKELNILQGVLETTLAGYWDWNIAEGTEYLSPTLKRMFGYADDELPNSPETWRKLIFAEDLPHVHEVLDRHVSSHGEAPYYNEVRYRHKDGSTVWVISAGRVVQWAANGDPVRMVGCHIDITPLHRRVDELAEASARADSANRAKSTFLANMSHEIRTPLNGIIGLSHILKRGGLDPHQEELLGKIDLSAQHLLDVINDVLDLSKIEAEKLELQLVDFDLGEIAGNIASMVQERVAAKGLQLTVDCADLGHPVRGDAKRFTQALLNLVGNAVKFTESGSVAIVIKPLEERASKVLIQVEVRDTGIGIAPEVMTRLFTPFEQGDKTTTRKYGGTGLGLAITKRLAELMGGDAGATSEVGIGSTFWFSAWLENAATPATRLRDIAVDSAESQLLSDFRGSHVLLVEDEPINLEVAMTFLKDAGLVPTMAADGTQAVELARRQRFSIVLMDMQMPIMDGTEATRLIRELPGWRTVPIIALSANAYAEDRKRCLAAGMNDFVSKPFDPEEFFNTLLHWLIFHRDHESTGNS